jgi:glycerol-3-phosphate acyltransferase PlsX
MGGDEGPAPVVAGLAQFLRNNPDVGILLHGPEERLKPLVDKRKISKSVTIVNAPDVVSMTDKPSHVMRHGKTTSMWSAVDAVRDGEASVWVSLCGRSLSSALSSLEMNELRFHAANSFRMISVAPIASAAGTGTGVPSRICATIAEK